MIVDEWREGHIGDEDSDRYDELRLKAIDTAYLRNTVVQGDLDELIEAYCDCGDTFNTTTMRDAAGRQSALFYWSETLFDGYWLLEGFERALNGDAYNGFDAGVINALTDIFGQGAIFQPARECGFVTIYVHGALIARDLTRLPELHAEAISFSMPNVLRLLFD